MVSALAFALLAVTPALALTLTPTHLYARQISGFDPSSIPTSCLQSQCQDLINTFSQNTACTTLDCICTDAIYTDLQKCLTCEASLDAPGVNQTFVQQTLGGYSQACQEGGHPVSASSGSGSSGSTGGSSGGSGSGSSSSSSAAAGGSSPSTSASGSTTTGGSTSNQKNSAIVGLGVSVVGSVVAFALSGVNVF